jgi:pimeloyl-ACP methyl ester carboxylesterase
VRLIRTCFFHLSVGAIAAAAVAAGVAQTGQVASTATFDVSVRGARVGFETVTVAETPNGWRITSTGRVGPPFDLVINKFELTYAPDWQPQKLTVDGAVRGQTVSLAATFGLTTAAIDMTQGPQRGSVVHQVSPRTLVLPNNFFAPYEAVAARLATAQVGAQFPVYVAPEREITLTVTAIAPQRMATPRGTLEMRQFDVSFANPGGTLDAEILVDARHRLARLVIPSQGLVVVREDLSGVVLRVERHRNAGDTDVSIPALGFNLAATLTLPAPIVNPADRPKNEKLPAVVLVAGNSATDRDETIANVPVFGQLAGGLAREGFAVVRYDRRGIGLSGGRTESATLASYADDVIAIVKWLRQRKDIDGDRVGVIGYGEGGPIALLAARREKRIGAVALVASPGVTGREFALEQQIRELDRLKLPDAERAAKIDLQRRLLDAAATGKGWDDVPAGVRSQADTPYFRSWALFDPATPMKDLRQPILILQGALDREVPASHADKLEAIGRARRKLPASHTTRTMLPNVNHLLIAAEAGDMSERAQLPSRSIDVSAITALAGWLRGALPPDK